VEAALKAITHPHRRTILTLVRDREMAAGAIAARFDVTGPAISQHLRVLKEAGLLTERRDGNRRLYVVRSEGLSDVREFLDQFWGESLARLKTAAETEEAERGKRGRPG
jgi:DNA-binding transcriptional ArsR family regulator